MTDAPVVSVAIRAWRRTWLAEAAASVLGQTYRDLELVVYDDAGDLADVTSACSDPRLRYVLATGRHGPSGRFAAAAAFCRGRYIALLDDDDRYEPELVRRLVEALEADAGAGVAFCRVAHLVDGRVRVPRDPRPAGRQARVPHGLIAGTALIPTSTMLVRRRALEAAVAWEAMPDDVSPDIFINVHAAMAGWGHVLVDAPLVLCRRHPAQLTRGGVAAYTLAIQTLTRLQLRGDAGLEIIRRSALVRGLVRRAVLHLAAGGRDAALEDLRAAAATDARTTAFARRTVHAAALVPGLGGIAARAALTLHASTAAMARRASSLRVRPSAAQAFSSR